MTGHEITNFEQVSLVHAVRFCSPLSRSGLRPIATTTASGPSYYGPFMTVTTLMGLGICFGDNQLSCLAGSAGVWYQDAWSFLPDRPSQSSLSISRSCVLPDGFSRAGEEYGRMLRRSLRTRCELGDHRTVPPKGRGVAAVISVLLYGQDVPGPRRPLRSPRQSLTVWSRTSYTATASLVMAAIISPGPGIEHILDRGGLVVIVTSHLLSNCVQPGPWLPLW